MRVGLVTTWEAECGIAEHSALLKEAVEQADKTVAVIPMPEALNPMAIRGADKTDHIDLLHLNYHAALHSQWTPDVIREFQANGIPVTVTYHDTGVPNSAQCKGVVDAATFSVVHEPFDDLPYEKVVYWRMGVQDWHRPHQYYTMRPILGTVGFPFPWKNYDELCRVTAALDWALLLIAPGHTAADVMRWEKINPHLIIEGFAQRDQVVSLLSGCDATAFCYTCANTGQSGAILQGIAARKPVIAFPATICRQFRALDLDPLGSEVIDWCDSFDMVQRLLRHTRISSRPDPGIVELAAQDSWSRLGLKYARLWQEHGQ